MTNDKLINQKLDEFFEFQELANSTLKHWTKFETMGFPSVKTPQQLFDLMTAPADYVSRMKAESLAGQVLEVNGLQLSASKLASFVAIPEQEFELLVLNSKNLPPKSKELSQLAAIQNGEVILDTLKFQDFKRIQTIKPVTPEAKAKFAALQQYHKSLEALGACGIGANIWAFPYRSLIHDVGGEPSLRFETVRAIVEG